MKNPYFLLLPFLLFSLTVKAIHPEPVKLPPDFGSKNEFAISCWIKLDSSMTNQGNYGILYKGSRSGFPEMQFQICIRRDRPEFKYISSEGKWRGIMMNGSDWVGNGKRIPGKDLPALRPDHWTMLTATFSHGTLALYVDGKEFFKTERNTPPPVNAHPVVFGKSEWGTGLKCWYFPGLIAQFSAFDKSLSAQEVAELEKAQRKNLDERQPIPNSKIPAADFALKLNRTSLYEKALPPPLPGTPNICAKIVKRNGIPQLTIDDQVISASAMMPSPYVSPAETEDPVRDFAAAGIRLYSTILWTQGKRNDWWLGEGKYDFSAVDRRLEALLKAAPQGYIFPRIKLDPPEWWIAENADEMETGNTVSPSSEKWRSLYRKMLEDLVLHIENSPYAGRVFAYQFGAFVGSEWLLYRRLSSGPSRKAWEKFANGKTDERQQDPFDPSAAKEPGLYAAFLSNEIADVILDAAATVKRITQGKKLTGIFYGYDAPSHQAFARIVNSPLIDFLCSPTSYAMRNAGESGQFTCKYWASLRLHNKMYFDEADIRTHYYKLRVDYRCANLKDSCNVLKRAIGYGLTRGTSLWWFLLVGNESFHDEEMMSVVASGAKENDILAHSQNVPFSPNAEVAVFCSSNYQTGTYFSDLLTKFYLDDLPRSGAPFDMYPIEDINHPDLPEYKMYIFLNPPEKMPEFHRKGFRVWIYQAGSTEIKTQKHVLDVPVTGHFVQGDRITGVSLKLSRFNTVIDTDAETIGTFDGKSAAAVKGDEAWFLSTPDIPSLHMLYEKAGVHIWNRSSDVLSAGSGYVMLHSVSAGEKTIVLPRRFAVKEIFHSDPAKEYGASDEIKAHFEMGETKVFRLMPEKEERIHVR